jgi:hypothetical protein
MPFVNLCEEVCYSEQKGESVVLLVITPLIVVLSHRSIAHYD